MGRKRDRKVAVKSGGGMKSNRRKIMITETLESADDSGPPPGSNYYGVIVIPKIEGCSIKLEQEYSAETLKRLTSLPKVVVKDIGSRLKGRTTVNVNELGEPRRSENEEEIIVISSVVSEQGAMEDCRGVRLESESSSTTDGIVVTLNVDSDGGLVPDTTSLEKCADLWEKDSEICSGDMEGMQDELSSHNNGTTETTDLEIGSPMVEERTEILELEKMNGEDRCEVSSDPSQKISSRRTRRMQREQTRTAEQQVIRERRRELANSCVTKSRRMKRKLYYTDARSRKRSLLKLNARRLRQESEEIFQAVEVVTVDDSGDSELESENQHKDRPTTEYHQDAASHDESGLRTNIEDAESPMSQPQQHTRRKRVSGALSNTINNQDMNQTDTPAENGVPETCSDNSTLTESRPRRERRRVPRRYRQSPPGELEPNTKPAENATVDLTEEESQVTDTNTNPVATETDSHAETNMETDSKPDEESDSEVVIVGDYSGKKLEQPATSRPKRHIQRPRLLEAFVTPTIHATKVIKKPLQFLPSVPHRKTAKDCSTRFVSSQSPRREHISHECHYDTATNYHVKSPIKNSPHQEQKLTDYQKMKTKRHPSKSKPSGSASVALPRSNPVADVQSPNSSPSSDIPLPNSSPLQSANSSCFHNLTKHIVPRSRSTPVLCVNDELEIGMFYLVAQEGNRMQLMRFNGVTMEPFNTDWIDTVRANAESSVSSSASLPEPTSEDSQQTDMDKVEMCVGPGASSLTVAA